MCNGIVEKRNGPCKKRNRTVKKRNHSLDLTLPANGPLATNRRRGPNLATQPVHAAGIVTDFLWTLGSLGDLGGSVPADSAAGNACHDPARLRRQVTGTRYLWSRVRKIPCARLRTPAVAPLRAARTVQFLVVGPGDSAPVTAVQLSGMISTPG